MANDGRKSFAVINGKESEKFDIVGLPVFSYDSKYIAYYVKDGGQSFIITSGKRMEENAVLADTIAFNDGKMQYMILKNSSDIYMVEKRLSWWRFF